MTSIVSTTAQGAPSKPTPDWYVWRTRRLRLARPVWPIRSDSCRSFPTVLLTSMVKRLQTVGNSSGVIIDKPILELLRITPETELDISTDGERLIITPLRSDAARKRKLARAQERTVAAHERTFRKLAKAPL